MPKEKPQITQAKINEELYGYVHRTDLRFAALQKAVIEYLKLSPEEKAKFENLVDLHYGSLLQVSMEKTEDIDAGLAGRLLDGQNPYS